MKVYKRVKSELPHWFMNLLLKDTDKYIAFDVLDRRIFFVSGHHPRLVGSR